MSDVDGDFSGGDAGPHGSDICSDGEHHGGGCGHTPDAVAYWGPFDSSGEDGTAAKPRSFLKAESPKALLEQLGSRERLIAYVQTHPEFKEIVASLPTELEVGSEEYTAALNKALTAKGTTEEVASLLSNFGTDAKSFTQYLSEAAGKLFADHAVTEKAMKQAVHTAEEASHGKNTTIIAVATAAVGAIAGFWLGKERNRRIAAESQPAQTDMAR